MIETSLRSKRLPIAVSMGDPAGIGGELSIISWKLRSNYMPPYFVIDDPDRLRNLANLIGVNIPIIPIDNPRKALVTFKRGLPVLPLDVRITVAPGKPDARYAGTVITSIDKSIDIVASGNASAIVTNPINKSTLYDAGFSHPGHTEYIATKTNAPTIPVMMLACASLRVVPVTIHLSLADAIKALTIDKIVHCASTTATALETDFGIANPRIFVSALNPHGGEQGHMGREEIDVILPAVEELRSRNIEVMGPFPADSLFHKSARPTYDAVICMHHDQALIPLKTIDFYGGVNVTLGLPFVRTSPDHGTALDIAGTGKANASSFIAAIELANEIANNRALAAASVQLPS